MRFAKQDIYVEVEGRRFIAARGGQPIPVHLAHLVDEKDTTETQPAGAFDATKVEGETSVAAAVPDENDRQFKIGAASDEQLLDLAAALSLELGTRGLTPKPEVGVPNGVEPGTTPGWPINAEGEPLDLPEQVREELAAAATTEAIDYDADFDKEQLEALVAEKVKVLGGIEGTGSGGKIVKADLVKALTDADKLASKGE